LRALRLAGLVVLALGPLLAPCDTGAQTPERARRVEVILLGGSYQVMVDGLRQGPRELGLEEDRHFVLDMRDRKSDLKGVEADARDLERGSVDVIFAVTASVAIAAKRATARIPMVFFAGVDPVAAGLVESLAKPGGRRTGVHGRTEEPTAKRLELREEMMPGLSRVVTFYNPDNAISRESARLSREAARQLSLQLVERHARSVGELRLGLGALKSPEVDAYFFTTDALVARQADLIIDVARAKKLPTMFQEYGLVAKGALASYGHSYHEIGRISAKYVQRILAGTSPRDLPVENYDKIELALNLRTAREIGLTIPLSVRDFANRVIE
jgi:putative ABC transport system substrate-binding protein